MEDYSQVIIECKHCNNTTAHSVAGICGDFSRRDYQIASRYMTRRTEDAYIYEGKMWALLQCKTCSMPSLVEGIGHIITREQFEPSLVPYYECKVEYTFASIRSDRFDPAKTLEGVSLKTIYPINATVAKP